MINKWKEMSSKRQRSIVLGGLGAIILLMAIGYAAFSSQLQINGTSNISSNWDIRITNITSSLSGGATNATEPTYDNENGLTASFSTNLTSPGDYAEYTIEVSNLGSIDATLTDIEISDSNNPAIVFETSGIEEGDNLLQGAKDELLVKVSYSDSVTSQPTNTTSNITVTLNYEQATGATPPVETETAADRLKELVTTTGDGLYADTYEEGRYIYKGANPNNYITFSGETWRIISVESDNTIKIMRNESIGDMAWDSTNSNNWARPATLNTYLNETYLPTLSDSDKVVSHNYSIGVVTDDNNDLADQINDENGTTWNGKVGLITASEYLRANTNTTQCETNMLNNENRETCLTTNWMYSVVPSGDYMWTISPTARPRTTCFYVFSDGGLSTNYASLDYTGVFPVLYLSSDITLQGEGTSQTPYTLG